MSDKIKIVFEDFQKATSDMQSVQDLLHDFKTELSNKYSMMRDSWKGTASEAFGVCMQSLVKDFEVKIENLGQLALDVEQAGQVMKAVDEQTADAITAG